MSGTQKILDQAAKPVVLVDWYSSSSRNWQSRKRASDSNEFRT